MNPCPAARRATPDAKQRINRKVVNKKIQNFTPKAIAWREGHDQGVKKEERF
jgi:hypothetical protein